MLHLLDEALEAFLRDALPAELRDIDIAFDAPDGEWGGGLSRPTVNLFLRDVRRNLAEREAGQHLTTEDNVRVWRRPPPRADCRYLLTAWTSEVADEHRILGQILAALLNVSDLSDEHLPPGLLGVKPRPSLSLASSGGDDQADFWSALGGQLKPGLDLLVTVTLDVMSSELAGPDVEQVEFRLGDPTTSRRQSRRRIVGGQAAKGTGGSVVRSPRDATLVDADGRFVIEADEGEEVVVESARPARGQVKPTGLVKPRRG